MDINERTDVIYQYIVQRRTMEDIAYDMGYSGTGVVSQIVKDGNFNRDRGTRNNFGGGMDLGRYAPGKPAARGIRVTHDMIYDYLCDVDYWGNFDNYIADIAGEMEEERARQQRQEQTIREQQQRQRQLEEQRRREQAARDEEFRRFQEQEQKRKAAEKAAKEKEYPRYIEQGLRCLKGNELQNAYNSFLAAQDCIDTYEVRAYIAETLANAENAASHSDTIVDYLECYKDFLAKNNKRLSTEYMLHLARAYRHKNNLGNSCFYFLLAGESYYLAGDYEKADAIYTENDRKNNRYDKDIVECAFRIAYSRSKKKDMTEADHRYCIKWYNVAVEQGQKTAYSYGNRSYHHRMIGNSYEAVEDAKEAISLGLHERYVYNNLLNAQIDNWDHADLMETLDEMDSYGYSYEPWIRGLAIENSTEHDAEEALPYYRQQIERNANHIQSLFYLTCYESDYRLSVQYGLRYLQLAKDANEKKWIRETVYVKAKATKDPYLIEKALEWNPEKRADYEAEKRQLEEYERQRKAEELRIKQEKERAEAEAEEMRLEKERMKEAEHLREEEHRMEEEKRRLEEERRLAEEAKAFAEKKKEEEELLLAILF